MGLESHPGEMRIERCPLDWATGRLLVALGVVKLETNLAQTRNRNEKGNFTCVFTVFVVSLKVYIKKTKDHHYEL